jgi:hypothetical protein
MFVFHEGEASRESFLAQDGTIRGRWALGEKSRFGRLAEVRWEEKIILRESRWEAGERAEPFIRRGNTGIVRAWCDGRQHYHEVDLAELVMAVHRGGSGVFVVGEAVG